MSGEQFDALPDVEQRLQIADDELERLACPDCGRQRDECGDAERVWYPAREVCYPTMETAAANDLWDRLHRQAPYHDGTFASWSKEPDRAHPYHYRAGVTIFVAESDLAPDDDFLGGTPPPEESADGEL